MKEIREGLKEGLDASWYANPKFKLDQINQIRLGLKEKVDVSYYAKPIYNWRQMAKLDMD